MKSFCLITFYSTHYAIKAEKILKNNGIDAELVPVPRKFSSNCGIALTLPLEKENIAMDIIKNNKVQIEKTYQWDRD